MQMPARRKRTARRAEKGSDGATPKAVDLFRCLLEVVARIALPEETVRGVVGKQLVKAYNLFDGTRALAEVAKAAGKDQGNLSRAVERWVQAGVAFRLGNGRGAPVLHAYRIPSTGQRRKTKGRG